MTKRIFKGIFNYIRKTDIMLWMIILGISAYSLILLGSVSDAIGISYDRTQLMAIIMGISGAIIISLLDYGDLANRWYIVAVFCFFLMVYTLITATPVVGSGGVSARAWINVAGRTFQSSELVKIGFLLTFSKHLDVVKKKGFLDIPLHVILLSFHAAVPVLLCHAQGDDGAGLVFLVMFLAMSFAAGIKLRYFLILGGILILFIPILWNYIFEDYQKLRFTAFLNLEDTTVIQNEGYQQYQGRTSIASGQWSGTGLGEGSRVASNVVTFQQSDFIFSVAGEELGFVGCVAIIFLLLLLLLKVLHTAAVSRDDLGKFISFGFFGLVAFQSISNIGMCLAVLPVMGVTLPFFSAGGSSAMCLYLGIGLLQSIYIRRKESDGMRLNRITPMHLGYRQMKQL